MNSRIEIISCGALRELGVEVLRGGPAPARHPSAFVYYKWFDSSRCERKAYWFSSEKRQHGTADGSLIVLGDGRRFVRFYDSTDGSVYVDTAILRWADEAYADVQWNERLEALI